jgi:hypothetical protein
MGGGGQYTRWDEYVMGRGARYTTWDEPKKIKDAPQYMEREQTLGNRADSYKEDHYPYARRDVVDDIVHEENFQDVNDKNEHFP